MEIDGGLKLMIREICIQCGEFTVEHEDDSYCFNCWMEKNLIIVHWEDLDEME